MVVNLERATDEDVVVAAATQSVPVGNAEVPGNHWLGGGLDLSAATF